MTALQVNSTDIKQKKSREEKDALKAEKRKKRKEAEEDQDNLGGLYVQYLHAQVNEFIAL